MKKANHEQPFDQVAKDYDTTFTYTQTGRLQRERVYTLLKQHLQEDEIQDIIEINCGTGEDAIWLVKQGKNVMATDISAEMVESAQLKRARLAPNIRDRLELKVCSITDLHTFNSGKQYDMLLSNFGGLNCLNPDELHSFLERIPQLIRPGGYLAMVIMGKFCWWESFYFLLKGQINTAARRIRRTPSQARLDDQTTIPTWYYGPKDIHSRLPKTAWTLLRPIGYWLPPSYLDPFFSKRPLLLQGLNWLEKQTGNLPFLAYGADHYLLVCKVS